MWRSQQDHIPINKNAESTSAWALSVWLIHSILSCGNLAPSLAESEDFERAYPGISAPVLNRRLILFSVFFCLHPNCFRFV